MFSIAIDVYDNKKNILIKSSPYRRCMQRLYQIAHVQTLHCTRTDVALHPYRRCIAPVQTLHCNVSTTSQHLLHRTDVALQRLYNTIQTQNPAGLNQQDSFTKTK